MKHWLDMERDKNFKEMKSVAFAACSHEFREPIASIINSLENLKSSANDYQYMNHAINSSKLLQY
jgi:signal transduction histidine kinase